SALANGFYVLRLTAADITGRVSQTQVTVEASTSTKPTQYLRSETDITVQIGTATVSLVRQYDSLNSALPGTFGFGWRLANRDFDIQTNVPPTGREDLGVFNPFRIGTRVYVTLPDGTRAGFTFAPQPHQQSGLTYYTPAFLADAGVAYQLSSAT